MLLALVEALVERLRRVSELLQTCSAYGHRVGTLAQPRDRIRPGLLRVVATATRLAASGALLHAVATVLGKIADRGFHRRPVLLLFGGELQSGLEAGDASIGERRDILGARPKAATFAGRRRLGGLLCSLLCKSKTCTRKRESD